MSETKKKPVPKKKPTEAPEDKPRQYLAEASSMPPAIIIKLNGVSINLPKEVLEEANRLVSQGRKFTEDSEFLNRLSDIELKNIVNHHNKIRRICDFPPRNIARTMNAYGLLVGVGITNMCNAYTRSGQKFKPDNGIFAMLEFEQVDKILSHLEKTKDTKFNMLGIQ